VPENWDLFDLVALLFWVLLNLGVVRYPNLTGAAGRIRWADRVSVLEVGCPNLDQYHILAWHFG